MSVAIGLAMAIHFPGAVGDTVLATVVAVTVAGEVSGPALRTVLMRAGEARARSPEPPPVSSDPLETSEQAEGSS
jgi:hypothetical protein